MKKIAQIVAILLVLIFLSLPAFAALLNGSGDVFEGWAMIADDDGVGDGGFVDPGWGGQEFDAEYLFVQQAGSVLSVGLQTGFDLLDGKITSGSKDYYAGDLALSFNGDASKYEYAFDFGLSTKGYYGTDLGTDNAGLYSVNTWSNEVYFRDSNPFAMKEGSLITGTITNDSGEISGSYYRMVSFDLANIEGLTFSSLDVHWTMSCGNDAVDGSYAPVPEPATMVLLSSGLVGLALYRRRMKK